MEKIDYDYLTGLYNRKGMEEYFNTLNVDEPVQVMFIDLDNFKTVNDMYGHASGDDTLIGFAAMIQSVVPSDAACSRIGGDEFVILIPGFYLRDKLADIAADILQSIRRERVNNSAFEVISASIGIVWEVYPGEGLDELLNYSDAAMYKAKLLGKDNYVFFDEYEDKILAEKEMEVTAATALKEGRFIIKYHPVIHLQSSKLLRTEACCFWKKNEKKIWGRNDFRPVLEKSGFIQEVDLYIFEELCKVVSRFRRTGRKNVVISVQFSYILFLRDSLIETLKEIMGRYGAKASDFELNLEEMVFGPRGSDRLILNMQKLKEEGFSIALTRFGEDFSSFRYLEDMPISAIKFDAGYIEENIRNNRGKRILKTLFELGKDMKFLVIGCGVSSETEAKFLATNGCDGASGKYYSDHLELEEYLDFITNELRENETSYQFRFKNDLNSTDGKHKGIIVGDGVEFSEGISDEWGGLSFLGGETNTNLVSFSTDMINGGSYTVSMWVKPMDVQNWISAFFVRYEAGFASFMPSVSGGVSVYRIHREEFSDVWHDVLIPGIPVRKWSFVTAVYDAFNESSRLYINGELKGTIVEVPNLTQSSMLYLGGDIYQVSYRGYISAFQIYKEAKSDEDIEKMYKAFTGQPGFRGDDEADEIAEYPLHDPAIYEDSDDKNLYLYTTDGNAWISGDIAHWKPLGRVVREVPKEAVEWTGSRAIWAPDIVRRSNEYRLYCSNSSFGSQRSCIFLATSSNPRGPFVAKKVVIKSDETLDINAIDANIAIDHETGDHYLLYGSFFGGIRLMPLDNSTGLPLNAGADGSGVGSLKLMPSYKEGMTFKDLSEEELEKRTGICLARRPLWNDGSIEGPYMIYHGETGYYYLFVSYGSLFSDYNIRVGRSKKITGPFLDFNGKDLRADSDEDCSVGLMIDCGYRWLTGSPYMAPGHNSALVRENGDMFIVSHIRKLRFCEEDAGPGLLQIRKMFMTPDGWPIVASEPYTNEALNRIRDEVIPGMYERIELRPSIPQGIMHSHPMELKKDGTLMICSVRGTWRRTGDYTLELKYGPITEFVHLEKGLDRDGNRTTVIMSGLSDKGICTWARKRKYF
ncbi:MAG: EAL domain-containing protein [Lachnospiraceae bacterium]|nr:EAL domain-containing protein [Lachnospiraceae bacterium]